MLRRAAISGPASLLALLAIPLALAVGLPAGCARDLPCQFNSDCPVGYCVDGSCKKDCVDSTRDCPEGYVCNANAQCVVASSSSSSSGSGGGSSSSSSGTGGASSSSSSSSSSSGSTSSSSSSGSTSSSSSSGGTMKHELDLCSSDGECSAGLICRSKVVGGATRCTRSCSADAQCMTGTRCELLGSEKYCAANDVGRGCTTGNNPCLFACLGDQYCTAECDTGGDCPNGYGCMQVSGFRVCVRAEADCSSADASQCIAPAACDESAQMYVGGCTLACDTAADCPQRASVFSPWTCNGLCVRPPDVHGPLPGGATPAQYVNDCQGHVVNVCNDNLNIDYNAFTIPSPPAAACGATTTTSGIATDSCLNSCRYQGGCSFGFACVGVGNVGSARIGLCLPIGGGEVGSACQHDAQCIFGYCAQGKCSRDCTADGVCPTGSSCVPGGSPAVDGQPWKRCQ